MLDKFTLGLAFTLKAKVLTLGVQGKPSGLFVVTVIVTVFPISPVAGVYSIVNGEFVKLVLVKLPFPLCVRLTSVADPPKVFPLRLKVSYSQIPPELADNVKFVGE